jgi:hypothetical protein
MERDSVSPDASGRRSCSAQFRIVFVLNLSAPNEAQAKNCGKEAGK